jgi:chromosome segregation ATPase
MQRYRDQIQAIADAERTIQELCESHQQVRASSVELMQDVMQTIKDVQLRTEPIRVEESKLLEELSQVEKVRQKHEGIIAQAEAEHRALMQNTASKPDPSFVAAFDRERKKRQEKLDIVIDKINNINNRLDRVRARLQEAKQEIDSLHQQRKSLHTDRARNEQQHEKRSGDAQNTYERAQAALGECGLIDDLKEIAQREITKARSAKETLEKIEQQTALYEKAKGSYDRSAFTRGLYLAGALTGLVIVALIAVSHLVPDSEASDLGVDEVTQEQIQP